MEAKTLAKMLYKNKQAANINWSGIAPFFSFPEDIRKAIYTTNAIESTNRQKGVFPDDKSIQKIIFWH
ncbi:transposase [Rickettsia sp. 2024-CO-Wats]|uniref:transposase n=1 Tax=unclassified Rickettsia TaxID=114295 RepID=UPI00370DC088